MIFGARQNQIRLVLLPTFSAIIAKWKVTRDVLDQIKCLRFIYFSLRHFDLTIFLQLGEQEVANFIILKSIPIDSLNKLLNVTKLQKCFLRSQDSADELKILQSDQRGVDRVFKHLPSVSSCLFGWDICASSSNIFGLRELNINDSRVEDVDEVLVLVDVFVDSVDIEVLMGVPRKLLQREKVLKNDSARLE